MQAGGADERPEGWFRDGDPARRTAPGKRPEWAPGSPLGGTRPRRRRPRARLIVAAVAALVVVVVVLATGGYFYLDSKLATHLSQLISLAFALRSPQTTTVPIANANYLTPAGDAVQWDRPLALKLFGDLSTRPPGAQETADRLTTRRVTTPGPCGRTIAGPSAR